MPLLRRGAMLVLGFCWRSCRCVVHFSHLYRSFCVKANQFMIPFTLLYFVGVEAGEGHDGSQIRNCLVAQYTHPLVRSAIDDHFLRS
jgi:hypothetical protein